MAIPTTREELKQYALRKLGAPVIQINVDDEQLEDSLDDAIQMFNEYHFDGVERALFKHEITAEEKSFNLTKAERAATCSVSAIKWH